MSNYKRYEASGHRYFSLKDEGAQIRVVLFRGNERNIYGEIRDGQTVIVTGSLGVFEKKGEYQIYARSAEVRGVGNLLAGARAAEAPPRGGGAVRRGAQAPASPVPPAARDRDVAARRRPARHGPGGALPLSGGGDRSRPVAGPGGRRGGGDRGGARRAVRLRRRGCRHRRAGGRLDRGPVGVQRGGGRAGHRPFPRSGHQRGRARDRLHAGRSCRGPPRSHPDRRRADGRPRPGRAPRPGRGPLPAGAPGRCPFAGNGPPGVADRRGETVGPAPPPPGEAVRRRRAVVLALGACALRGPGRPGNRRAPLRLGADPLPRGVGFRKARGARGPSRPRARRRGRAEPPPPVRPRYSRRQAGVPQSDRRAHAGVRDRARPRHREGGPFRLGGVVPAGRWTSGFPTARSARSSTEPKT